MNDQIYFPDNPNDDNIFPKTDLMIDIYQTCRDWLHEILEFVDTSSVLVFEMIAKMVINDEDARARSPRPHRERARCRASDAHED